MSWGTLGTVRPFSNFHPERDAMDLQSALENKGLGGSAYLCIIHEFLTTYSPDSDTVTLVRILTNRSNAQRQVIAKTFGEIAQKVIELAQVNSDIQSKSWTGCKTILVVVLCSFARTQLSFRCVRSSICLLIKHGLAWWWKAETPHLCLVRDKKQEWQ